jgi:hypothetical protein
VPLRVGYEGLRQEKSNNGFVLDVKEDPAHVFERVLIRVGVWLEQSVQHRFRQVVEINLWRCHEEMHLKRNLSVSWQPSLETWSSRSRNAAGEMNSPRSFTLAGLVAGARYWSHPDGVYLC